MLVNKVFRQIFDAVTEINTINTASVVIAGGAVVDFDNADDIDVFLLDPDGATWAEQIDDAKALLGYIADKVDGDTHYTDAAARAAGYHRDRLHVGSVYRKGEKPIQVIAAIYVDAGRLIDSFDLSVHAWAVTFPHYLLGSLAKSTGKEEPIRVNRWDTPSATLKRLHKLTTRYPHAGTDPSDITKLTMLIEKERN